MNKVIIKIENGEIQEIASNIRDLHVLVYDLDDVYPTERDGHLELLSMEKATAKEKVNIHYI